MVGARRAELGTCVFSPRGYDYGGYPVGSVPARGLDDTGGRPSDRRNKVLAAQRVPPMLIAKEGLREIGLATLILGALGVSAW